MTGIPQNLVDSMMVKCGRRCCICRRFRPTKLQVHHIHERSQGGGNEEDNLIVTCLSCHSDVHTKVPFALRFSEEELRGHRDALVEMAAEGRLPTADSDDADETIAGIIATIRKAPETASVPLMPEAVELLLAAARTEGDRQGLLYASTATGRLRLIAGNGHDWFPFGDRRAEAKYKAAVEQLFAHGLVDGEFGLTSWVSHSGYLAADEIAVSETRARSIGDGPAG